MIQLTLDFVMCYVSVKCYRSKITIKNAGIVGDGMHPRTFPKGNFGLSRGKLRSDFLTRSKPQEFCRTDNKIPPLVGAIRWDARYSPGSIPTEAVENSL